MKTVICVNINRDHMYGCDTYFIGRSGENESTQFQIKLEDCLCDSWVYIDFIKPDGTKYKTPRLDIVDGTVTYDVTNELLTNKGTLKAQIVLQNETGIIWKSTVKSYEIIQSIDATEDIPNKEDFITEAQNLLDDIEAGLTPTIGNNENWFVGGKDTGKPSRGPKGDDYIIDDKDLQEIEAEIKSNLQPLLDNTLKEANDYADSIKPTKTSELTNDSNFAKTDQNNNFKVSQTINGTLTINGDVVQNGNSYETHAEQVYTKNDEIITRDGAVGGLSEGEYTGIKALLYDGANNGRLGFNASGEARVGDIGDEQPLLTRDEVANLRNGQVLTWDNSQLKAVGSDDFIKNTDAASVTKMGISKMWVSANEDGELGLNISTEV